MARASASEIRWDIDGKSNCVRLTFVVEVSAIAQNNGAFNHQSQGEGEILRTLPLSGRQEAHGGAAESLWWPVHSRGLLYRVSTVVRLKEKNAVPGIVEPRKPLVKTMRSH